MSFNQGPIRNRAGMPTAVHKMLLGKFRSKNGLWTFMSDRAVSGDYSFIFMMLTFIFAGIGLRVTRLEEDADATSDSGYF